MHIPENRAKGKKVQFMLTCLCDAFYDNPAKASVEVLEHLGCEIEFPENQTCCGQPAFNAGDWESSRKVIRHMLKTFKGDSPIIIPSGSCAAMLLHGAPMAFEGEPDLNQVKELSRRAWEITDFIVNGLGVKSWGGSFNGRIALHEACHTRGTQTIESTIQLFKSISGIELLDYNEKEQCCGFGGTFSVTFPHISAEMGKIKINHLTENKPDYIVSPDMSCMMHQKGIADKEKLQFEVLHITQVLKTALKIGEEI